MEVLFHGQPIKEEGEGPTRPAHVNGVRQHPSLEQLGQRLHVLATVFIQQRVAQAVVLFEE
jgi:hypothetical protein